MNKQNPENPIRDRFDSIPQTGLDSQGRDFFIGEALPESEIHHYLQILYILKSLDL